MAEAPMNSQATTIPPDVRVRLTRGSGGYPELTSTHRLPSNALVLQELTSAQRALIPTRYKRSNYTSLVDLIQQTASEIPLQVWSDAIGAATIRGLACTSAAAETFLQGMVGTGYMAIGGSLIKLTPVAHVGASKAMATLKKQAIDQAKAEAESIRLDAQQAAKTIVNNAQIIKQQAEELAERVARETGMRVPPWVATSGRRIPLRLVDGKWHIGMYVDILVIQAEYRLSMSSVNWTSPNAATQTPVKYLIWVPVNDAAGSYATSQARVDSACPVLPHMHHTGSCMGISDAPALLDSYLAYVGLKEGFERTYSVITLNSLLQGPELWLPQLGKFLPADLVAILKQSSWKTQLSEIAMQQQAGQPTNTTATAGAGTANEGTWTA